MADESLPEGTYCGSCRRRLDEGGPCPCGATSRRISVHDGATVETRTHLYTRAKSPAGTRRGLSGRRIFLETWTGDDYHRDAGVWNRLVRIVDRAKDWYYEHITAPDGRVIVHQDEPLSRHDGHGSAKRNPPQSRESD